MKDQIEEAIDKAMVEEIDKRVTKEDAGYGKAMTCIRCRHSFHWARTGECRKVIGPITGTGFCDYFQAED